MVVVGMHTQHISTHSAVPATPPPNLGVEGQEVKRQVHGQHKKELQCLYWPTSACTQWWLEECIGMVASPMEQLHAHCDAAQVARRIHNPPVLFVFVWGGGGRRCL